MKKYLFIFPLAILGVFLLPHFSFAANYNILDTSSAFTSGNEMLGHSGGWCSNICDYGIMYLGTVPSDYIHNSSDILHIDFSGSMGENFGGQFAFLILNPSGGVLENLPQGINSNTDNVNNAGGPPWYRGDLNLSAGDTLWGDVQGNYPNYPFHLASAINDSGSPCDGTSIFGTTWATVSSDMDYYYNNFCFKTAISPAVKVYINNYVPPAPTISVTYPTASTTVPFDNYQLQTSNTTSTDQYSVAYQTVEPGLGTSITYPWQVSLNTLNINAGNIPFLVPTNLDYGSGAETTYSTVFYLYDESEDHTLVASTTFNFSVTPGTFFNVSSTAVLVTQNASGTLATTSVPYQGGLPIGTTATTTTLADITGECVAPPTSTTPFTDPVNWAAYGGCWIINQIVMPHQFSQTLAANSFQTLQGDVPFSFVFAALNGFQNAGTALEVATSSDLSFSFLPSAGHGTIIPSSSMSIISQSAYASLISNTGGTSMAGVFQVEDYMFYFALLALAVGLTLTLL